MVLAFSPPPHPSREFPGKSQSPHGYWGRVRTGESVPGLGGGRPGNPSPLTLDPAAPAFCRGGRISSGGDGGHSPFEVGTRASPGEGVGFGVPRNCKTLSAAPAPPWHLLLAPSPAAAISYLHAFLRHGDGHAVPCEGPHCALGGPLPGRATRSSSAQGRGRGSAQAPPFLPGLLFRFRCWGGALAPSWLRLCSCASNPGGRPGSAPCG